MSKHIEQAKEYVAIKRGYDGVKVIEVGEKFMFSGEPSDWMKLASDKQATKDDLPKTHGFVETPEPKAKPAHK